MASKGEQLPPGNRPERTTDFVPDRGVRAVSSIQEEMDIRPGGSDVPPA